MKLNKGRPISLTMRMVLFVATTATLCLILTGQLVVRSIQHHFKQQDAEELSVILHSIEQTLRSNVHSNTELSSILSRAVSGHHGVFYQVQSNDGQMIYRNSELQFNQFYIQAPISEGFNFDDIVNWQKGNQFFRGLVTKVSIPNTEYLVIIASDMSFHLHFIHSFQQVLWLIILGACLLILMAAWFAMHQGLKPLRGLSNKMHDIQTNKLDVRLNAQEVPRELENMLLSFNHMLDRLEQGFSRLSHFSADIAHEMRTPLTNMITQTQVSLSKQRTPEAYRELLFSNLEEQERLNKIISDMLWLAKSHNGLIKPQRQTLTLQNEIKALFEFFEALAEDSGLCLTLVGQAKTIKADQNLLRLALTNLLSNAIRHTPRGEEIKVILANETDDAVTITVDNPGEEIPAAHLPHLFQRFYRVDQSRQRHSDGAGLGLAITQAIVLSHGGNISVTSDKNHTCFIMRFDNVKTPSSIN